MSLTRVAKIDPLNIEDGFIRRAGEVLKSGGLVIIPTETVYGVAASITSKKAIERLNEIKDRPKNKPFTIAIDKKERVEVIAKDIPMAAYKLMYRFWPGPLTLVLKGANSQSVGVRLPDNEIALRIIAAANGQVALPSANRAGKTPPVYFEDAMRDLSGSVDLAIDGGPGKLGIESSIVDFTVFPMKILRLGAVSKEDIEKVTGKKDILFVCTGNSCRSVMAEAFFKKMMQEQGRDDVSVSSAGIISLSGLGASDGAQEVLKDENIDVSGHVSRRITREMCLKSDLILVMEKLHENAVLEIAPAAKNRVFLLKEFAKMNDNNLDIEDPIGKPPEYYRQTFASIKEALERVSKLI